SRASNVGSLRNVPRQSPTDVFLKVSAGPIFIARAGTTGVWPSVVRGSDRRWVDVRKYLLDAPGLASGFLCIPRGVVCGRSIRSRQLLGQLVLGRRVGGDWRRADTTRTPASGPAHRIKDGRSSGSGNGYPRMDAPV